MKAVTEITQEEFPSRVLKNSLPVLVDFWAEWCGPCRMVGPVVEEIARERQGRLAVFKLDVQEYPDVAVDYDVQSIPSLILFRQGKVLDKVVGAFPKASLDSFLDRNLKA